jgi:hypothetical protein
MLGYSTTHAQVAHAFCVSATLTENLSLMLAQNTTLIQTQLQVLNPDGS